MSLLHMFLPLNNFTATPSGNTGDGFIGGPMGYHGVWGPGEMMGGFGVFGWFFTLVWLVTWILLVVALVALIRWLWKKGDK